MGRIDVRIGRLARGVVAVLAAAGVVAVAGCGGASEAGGRDEGAMVRRSPAPVREAEADSMRGVEVDANVAASRADAAGPEAAAPARVKESETAARPSADRQAWRPAWWIVSPVREGGLVRVAAMADDADLLEARRKAVNLGLSDLRAHIDVAEDGLTDADTTIDVISLPDGRYRAFVLVEAAGG